jgi:O-antigen ligase
MEERLAFNAGDARKNRDPVASRVEPRPSREKGVRRQSVRGPADLGYLGLLVFTALLFFRPQDQIAVLDGLPLALMAAVVGLLAMLIGRMRRGLAPVRFTPELLGMVAFGMAILASIPFSIWPGGAFGLFKDEYLRVFLIFVLMVNTLHSQKRFEQLVWLIIAACAYLSAWAIVDYVRGVNLVEGHRVGGAVGGIFGNPNDLAANLVTFFPLAFFMFLKHELPNRRVLAAAAGVLMVAAIVFTKSRSGAVGLAVVWLMMVFYGSKFRPGLVGVAVVLMLAALPFLPGSFWNRVASIVYAEQDDTGSRETRRIVMREAFQAFLDHPVIGVGAGQFVNYDPQGREERWRVSHNALLQVMAELGVLGLLPFLFLIIRAGLGARWTYHVLRRGPPGRNSRRQRLRAAPRATTLPPAGHALDSFPEADRERLAALGAALLVGLVGWFVGAMFASIAYNWTFYYLLALATIARDIARTRLREEATAPNRDTQPVTARARAS